MKNEDLLLAGLGVLAVGGAVICSKLYKKIKVHSNRIDATKEQIEKLEEFKELLDSIETEKEA